MLWNMFDLWIIPFINISILTVNIKISMQWDAN